VTPLSDSNEDEYLAPGDDIERLLHHDLSTPIISVVSILEGFIDEPPLEENNDLFDLESKENDWKKILYDAPIDDLITEDKVFDPGIYEKSFSSTFVKLTFEDRHYFPITFVIRIFLPYLTYSVDSPFLLSSGSEDTIFDPDISTFHFFSLNPVAYENPMVIFPFFCFCPQGQRNPGRVSKARPLSYEVRDGAETKSLQWDDLAFSKSSSLGGKYEERRQNEWQTRQNEYCIRWRHCGPSEVTRGTGVCQYEVL
ncbi:hypothetical protein Tco_1177153, partial [Tanacetum coccineum]